jgi:hypothetical protein
VTYAFHHAPLEFYKEFQFQIRPKSNTKSKVQVEFKDVLVHVVDENGDPVAGANVEAFANHKPIAIGQTNSAGLAKLQIPEGTTVMWIAGLKDGVGFDYYENGTMGRYKEELPEQIKLIFDGARAFTVNAVDTDGKPIEGASIVPWTLIKEGKQSHINLSGSKIASVVTNSNGQAVFNWFPAKTNEILDIKGLNNVRPGTEFITQSSKYSPTEYQNKTYHADGDKKTIRLLKNTTISGRVSRPNGKAAANVTVMVEGRGKTPFFCRREVKTDNDGYYEVKVTPNQVYMITAIDDKLATATKGGIVVRENEPIEDINFDLIEGTVIEGAVTKEKDGSPFAGNAVFLRQEGASLDAEFRDNVFGDVFTNAGLIRTATPDANGKYSFTVGPGRYMIGTLDQVSHSSPGGEKITVGSQKTIKNDITSESGNPHSETTVGIAFANDEKVYNGTMVFSDCSTCHYPMNSKPKPPK